MHLAIEAVLTAEMSGRDGSLSSEGHWGGECGEEAGDSGVRLDGFDLVNHLLFHLCQPRVGIQIRGIPKLLPHQFFRFRDGRKRGEEFGTRRHFIDRDTGEDRFDNNRHFHTDKDSQRPKFAECEPHRETFVHDQQFAFEADKQNTVSNRGCRIETVNQIAAGIQLEDTAKQAAGNFGSAKVTANLDNNRFQIGDWELALLQQTHIKP